MARSFIHNLFIIGLLLVAAEGLAVSQEAWIEGFKREFPKMTCTDDQIFRTMYKTTKEECMSKMLEATEYCIAQRKDKLPADFDSVDQGREWGEDIGKCAGTRFAQTAPLDPKGIFKMLPPGLTSGRVIGIAAGIALAFFAFVGLIIFWAVRQRRKP